MRVSFLVIRVSHTHVLGMYHIESDDHPRLYETLAELVAGEVPRHVSGDTGSIDNFLDHWKKIESGLVEEDHSGGGMYGTDYSSDYSSSPGLDRSVSLTRNSTKIPGDEAEALMGQLDEIEKRIDELASKLGVNW
jgi:hypothetical protein